MVVDGGWWMWRCSSEVVSAVCLCFTYLIGRSFGGSWGAGAPRHMTVGGRQLVRRFSGRFRTKITGLLWWNEGT